MCFTRIFLSEQPFTRFYAIQPMGAHRSQFDKEIAAADRKSPLPFTLKLKAATAFQFERTKRKLKKIDAAVERCNRWH